MDKDTLSSKNAGNRKILSVLAMAMLLASLGTSIANIALPRLADSFSAPFSHVQWVVTAYLATLTLSSVFVGRLGDIYGLRPMHLTGLGMFCAASLFCGLAPNLWFLIGARALQGIAAAFLMTLSIALVRDTLGDARTGRGMGLLGTMSALGTALGPSLGGMLLAAGSWRGIFLVQVPLAALTLIFAGLVLPRVSDQAKASPGSMRRVLSLHLLPALGTNLLVATVMMTTLIVGPFYLGQGLGLNDVAIGLTMSIGPVISIFSGIPSGRAVDAWGADRVLRFGLALLATGAFALSFLPVMFGIGGYVLAIAILTPGYQLFQAANNTRVMAEISRNRRGIVSGLLGLSRNLGLILGASVMGMIFAIGVGSNDFAQASSPQIEVGMKLVFTVAGAMMVLALGIAFRCPAGNRTD